MKTLYMVLIVDKHSPYPTDYPLPLGHPSSANRQVKEVETPIAVFPLETEAEALRFDLEEKGYEVYVQEIPFAHLAEDVSRLYPSMKDELTDEWFKST